MKSGMLSIFLLLTGLGVAHALPDTAPPTASTDTLTPLIDALTQPVLTAAAPLTNVDTALADAKFLLNDLKRNTRLKVNGVESGMVYDTLNGRTLLGSQVPFAAIGSYDTLALGLFTPVVSPVQVAQGAKGALLLSNDLDLNSITRPIVNSIVQGFPVLKNNLPLVTNLSQALKVGVSAGHDQNVFGRSKIVFNTAGVSLTLFTKFTTLSDLLKAQQPKP